MRKALIVVLPYPSHYAAIRPFIGYLIDCGWELVTTTIGNVIKSESWPTPIAQFPYLPQRTAVGWREFLGYSIKSRLEKSLNLKYVDLITDRASEINQIIKDGDFDTVFLDAHLGHYSLFIDVDVILLHTKISSRYTRFIPPFTSNVVMSRSMLRNQIVSDFTWLLHLLNRQIIRQKSKFIFNGLNDISIYKFLFSDEVGWDEKYDFQNALFDNWVNVPRLILSPKSFEYPWYRKNVKDEHIWFPVEKNATDSSLKYLTSVDIGKPIVYLSLGTLNDLSKNELSFFRKVISVAADDKTFHLVVSAGLLLERLDVDTFNNVSVLERVDQCALLTRCKVFITHGGLNSVKEAIQMAVPMLVYPINKKVDQPGNAARIVYHGLGLQGDIRKDSESDIHSKIKRLLNDASFAENCKRMMHSFYESLNNQKENLARLQIY